MNRDQHYSIGEWWRLRLVPALALVVLLADLAFAAVMVTAPETEFTSAIFTQARSVMNLNSWGVLLLCLASFTGLMWWVQGRCRLAAFMFVFGLGSGYWVFWTILSLWSSFGPNGVTGVMATLSAPLAATHVLVGLAWPVPHDHLRLRA